MPAGNVCAYVLYYIDVLPSSYSNFSMPVNTPKAKYTPLSYAP